MTEGGEIPSESEMAELQELVRQATTPEALRRAVGVLERHEGELRRRQAWAAIEELRALRRRVQVKLASLDHDA